jgi:hypothetical protein
LSQKPIAPPLLRTNLKEPLSTVFDHFMVDILARSPGGEVRRIAVNGSFLELEPASIVGLSHGVDLTLGKNLVKVEVWDHMGQKTEKSFGILRKAKPSTELSQRAVLSVLPLDRDEGGSTHLLSQMILETQRYRLVERERMENIMAEQKISNSLFADKDGAIRIGKLLSARYALTGEVRMGKDFEMVTRMIDNETGEILAMVDAYAPNLDRSTIKYSLRHLSHRLREVLPWFEAELVSRDGRDVIIRRPEGVTPVSGQDFLILHKEQDIVDDETGVVLLPGEELILGKARLKTSNVATLRCEMDVDIPQGAYAIRAVSR